MTTSRFTSRCNSDLKAIALYLKNLEIKHFRDLLTYVGEETNTLQREIALIGTHVVSGNETLESLATESDISNSDERH